VDVNRDTVLDLVHLAQSSNGVFVRLGDGSGGFPGAGDFYSVGVMPTDVASADLDGDISPDLVVVNATSGDVSILLNAGDGTFGSATSYGAGTLGGTPESVALSDVNGDGDVDVVVGTTQGPFAVLPGTGMGDVDPAILGDAGPNGVGVEAADLNGDGDDDLALVHGSTHSTVDLLLGNGTGSFGVLRSPAASPLAIASADLDSDGDLDLVTADSGGVGLSVYRGTGNGTFGAPTQEASGFGVANLVTVGDLDHDGNLDLVASDGTSASVLLGNVGGTFDPAVVNLDLSGIASMALADMNRDGNLDIVVNNGSGQLQWQFGDGLGAFTGTVFSTPADLFARELVISDLDGDGDLEVVLANPLATLSIFTGIGVGPVVRVNVPTLANATDLALGDLDGDGDLDLAASSDSTNGIQVHLNDGTGDLTALGPLLTVPVRFLQDVLFADLDVDGRPDLVGVSDRGSVTVFRGNGVPVVLFDAPSFFGVGNGATEATIGDLNRDGRPDVTTANFGGSDLSVLLGR
jgi:hypothetical protein